MLVERCRSLHRDRADRHLSAAVPTGAYVLTRRILRPLHSWHYPSDRGLLRQSSLRGTHRTQSG